MKIAIYGSRHQDEYVERIARLFVSLSAMGDELVVHRKIYDYMVSKDLSDEFAEAIAKVLVIDDDSFSADVAMSIGGDGTFLRTAQWVGDKELPIIGVNTGHLGFLAPFTVDEAAGAVELFRHGKTSILERGLIKIDSMSDLGDLWPYALNEVAVMKKDTASMITIDARVNGSAFAVYKCDGLIVSTPTGSTGYNLSVGGPIVEPGSPSRIISPVAAHSLSMRPLVVSAESLIELRVGSRSTSYRVSLDGRTTTLPCGTSIFASRADFVVRSVCKPDRNFYATLRDKLYWGN